MNPTFLPSPTTCCPGLQLIYCALGCSQHKLQYSKSFCSILQGDRAQPQPLAACHTKLGGCSGDGAQGSGTQEGGTDPGPVHVALDQGGKFPREFRCPVAPPRPQIPTAGRGDAPSSVPLSLGLSRSAATTMVPTRVPVRGRDLHPTLSLCMVQPPSCLSFPTGTSPTDASSPLLQASCSARGPRCPSLRDSA